MLVCGSCGFDAVEDGKPCPLCGGSPAPSLTINLDAEATLRDMAPGPYRSADGHVRPVGSLYADRYRIERVIGRGGMGTVFHVTDTKNGEPRALKILHAAATSEAEGSGRFQREITILSKMNHPAVPRIYEWGVHDREMYFISELIDGEDLRMKLRRDGAFDPVDAASLAATIADALAIAHERRIVHRDVKPHNVMLARDGSVKLLDFGVARGIGIDMKTITATGMIVGTPEYMSPEQFSGVRVDGRCDIYSLGVVLFEMLTGKLPFVGDTPVTLAIKHQTEAAPPPRTLRGDIPAWLDRIVLKCLEKEPAKRFHYAHELAAELRKVREGIRRSRTLATGDTVLEDETEIDEWALVLSSAEEKRGWKPGMALQFEDRFYRLEQMTTESKPEKRFVYRFCFWPSEEILRGFTDFEQHAAEEAVRREATLKSKFKKLFQ